MVAQFFWWPNLFRDVAHYVRSCRTCAAAKNSTSLRLGVDTFTSVPSFCARNSSGSKAGDGAEEASEDREATKPGWPASAGTTPKIVRGDSSHCPSKISARGVYKSPDGQLHYFFERFREHEYEIVTDEILANAVRSRLRAQDIDLEYDRLESIWANEGPDAPPPDSIRFSMPASTSVSNPYVLHLKPR